MIWTIDWWGYSVIEITDDNVEEAVIACNQGQADGIRISEKYKSDCFDFLGRLEGLRALVVAHPQFPSPLVSSMEALRCLHLQEPVKNLDLNANTRLQWLSLYWHRTIKLPPADSDLQSLTMFGYAPRSKNLSELPPYHELLALTLRGGGLRDLSGITRFGSLRHTEFTGLRSLASFQHLADTAVESLNCEGLPRCLGLEHDLAKCGSLKRIVLAKCPPLRSLGWIRSMRNLRKFRFVHTDVLDGDMSPLLTIADAAFYPNRRHFSHTCEAIATRR